MKKYDNFVQWIVGRWYFWVVLVFAVWSGFSSVDNISLAISQESSFVFGILIGSVVIAAIIPAITYLMYKKRRKKR